MYTRAFHTTCRRLVQDLRRNVIEDLPKVSGGGPFAEIAKFAPVGPQASLLYVTIPASATVYTRRGTIVGVSGGQLSDIKSDLATDQPLNKLARAPFVYQRVSTVAPVNLLVGAKNTTGYQNSYAVVPVTKDYDWIVAQRKALLGWANAVVEPYSSLKQWGNIKASSDTNGQLALVGEGQIFQLEVANEETIFVNPANVIAYTRQHDDSTRSFRRLPHTRARLELPVLPFDTPWLSKLNNMVKTMATKFWRNDVALQISGPRTILVQTRATHLNHVFDKHELEELLAK